MKQQRYLYRPSKNKTWILIICYSIICFFNACSDKNTKQKLNTEHIKLNINSVRYDHAIYSMNKKNVIASLDSLGTIYPDFTNIYIKRLIGFDTEDPILFEKNLLHFLSYKDYVNLYDSIQKKFPDVKSLDKELTEVLKNVKYYFPEENFKEIYYFTSGLNNWNAITMDNAIGVGLDMFLGKDYPFYAAIQLPDYDIQNRIPEQIPIQVAKAIFEAKYPPKFEGSTLLDMMIYKGKELYFVENVCRDAKDYQVIAYPEEKEIWCKKNESMIFNFFLRKNILYETTWQISMPYVNAGPNTAGMPPESPGNIGSWLGWQLVRNYMRQNSKTEMKDLLNLKIPAQEFLRKSKYKP